MPKIYSSRRITSTLIKNGFKFISQKGSPAKFFNHTSNLTVIIPIGKKEIPMGTFISILKQSKLQKENFEN
jgi:predicted RNA binding protein YcfA (HicA-like mRNA interferase family)